MKRIYFLTPFCLPIWNSGITHSDPTCSHLSQIDASSSRRHFILLLRQLRHAACLVFMPGPWSLRFRCGIIAAERSQHCLFVTTLSAVVLRTCRPTHELTMLLVYEMIIECCKKVIARPACVQEVWRSLACERRKPIRGDFELRLDSSTLACGARQTGSYCPELLHSSALTMTPKGCLTSHAAALSDNCISDRLPELDLLTLV
jgi:hypothetical protein